MNEQLITKLVDGCISGASRLVFASLVLIIGFKLTKVIVNLMGKSKGFQKIDPGASSFLQSFIKIVLKVVVILSAAGILGVPMTSFITILGSAGVAIGLALQGSLTNIAGGLIILLFKPFNVGDTITAGDITGVVSSIGAFYTKILTFDNQVVVIPNGTISNQTLINVSDCDTRRVDITFSVGYECDHNKVKEVLLNVAKNHPKVLSDPEPMARLTQHGDSALDFTYRVWCKTEDYWDVYFDMEEMVKEEFDKNNISIPYPQLDVHIDK